MIFSVYVDADSNSCTDLVFQFGSGSDKDWTIKVYVCKNQLTWVFLRRMGIFFRLLNIPAITEIWLQLDAPNTTLEAAPEMCKLSISPGVNI